MLAVDIGHGKAEMRRRIRGESEYCLDAGWRLPAITTLLAIVHLPMNIRLADSGQVYEPLLEGDGWQG